MATFTESTHVSDIVKREFDQLHNRETVTVVSGQNLAFGAVVGKITASGKYAAYNNAAATGVEVAAGVLLEAANASGGDVKAVILKRGPAVVSRPDLVFAGGTSDNDKNAAYADLEALGIVARAAV